MKWHFGKDDLKGSLVKLREHARRQAQRNALTLFFMSVGFIITWVFILVANYGR